MRALALVLLLAGCATPPRPTGVCPVVVELSPRMQDRFADELEALPGGYDNLRWALIDWSRMRDEARAICGYERMEAKD